MHSPDCEEGRPHLKCREAPSKCREASGRCREGGGGGVRQRQEVPSVNVCYCQQHALPVHGSL